MLNRNEVSNKDNTIDLKEESLSETLSSFRDSVNRLGGFESDKIENLMNSLPEIKQIELGQLLGAEEDPLRKLLDAAKGLEIIANLATQHIGMRANGLEIEAVRAPQKNEPTQIALNKVLVIEKQTKLERIVKDAGYSGIDEAIASLESKGLEVDSLYQGYLSHKNSTQAMREIFDASQFLKVRSVDSEELIRRINQADLIISAGGDDTLKDISRFISDQFILGLNSDPDRSHGALLPFNSSSIENAMSRLERGDFLIEDWTRLETSINGVRAPRCLSEILISDELARYGSRLSAKYKGEDFQMQGSGLLVSSGTGSTGWYSSASRYSRTKPLQWARTSAHAQFVEREPWGGAISLEKRITDGSLKPGEILVLESLLGPTGAISIDSIVNIPFARGARAEISISDQPLKVISSRI